MNKAKEKQQKRVTRHRRIRAKLSGTAERPRLSVYKSNRAIYAQIIDDDKGVTLVAGTEVNELVKKALTKKITRVVFDRGGFNYTGKIKQFADEARKAGLEF
ncbi:MAG: 50S ribosomal protein L18 [Patescibacteria group bacterium]